MENEQKTDISPLREHAISLRRKIYQVQSKIVEEVFNFKNAEVKLQDILATSTKFKSRP